jgi:hypothetical protein
VGQSALRRDDSRPFSPVLGVIPLRARHTAHAIAAFLIGATLAALALVFILPVPPARTSNFPNFGQLIALSLVGPIFFAWAWGPASLSIAGLLAAVAIPFAAIATLFLGFVRRKSYLALVCAAVMWNAFGGFSAFIAVTGSL